jgi:hypothetical protein
MGGMVEFERNGIYPNKLRINRQNSTIHNKLKQDSQSGIRK